MPGDAEFSPEHPAARIRAKLEERRVLEARFLLRQFSDELDAGQRQALEQEVRRLLAEVDRLRHQARTAAAEGQREEAGKLYRDIEQLAVDVPGLSEEQAALAGAEAVFARLSVQDSDAVGDSDAGSPASEDVPSQVSGQEQPAPEDVPPQASVQEVAESKPLADTATAAQELRLAIKSELQQAIASAASTASAALATVVARLARRPRRFPGLWLVAGGCAGLAVLILLLIWPSRPQELAATPPAPPVQAPARDIAVEPATSVVPAAPTKPTASPSPPPKTPVAVAAKPKPPPSQKPASPPPEPGPMPASPQTGPEPAPVALPQIEPTTEQAAVPQATDPQPTDPAPTDPPPTFKLGALQIEQSTQK